MGGTKKAGILADCPGEVRVAPIIATVNVSGKMQAHILNRIFPWSGGYGAQTIRKQVSPDEIPSWSRGGSGWQKQRHR